MTSRARVHIAAMKGYVPGFQPKSDRAIKLNTNENPYPPGAAVMEALSTVDAELLRKYPSPFADDFRRAAASVHGVGVDQIMATNGGDELLRLALTTFVEPGRAVGVFDPSYSLYEVLAEIHRSGVFPVPLAADWLPPEDAAAQLNAAQVPLTFVVNPHAPSGVLLPMEFIETLATRLDGLLLVDEAYVDFIDPALDHDAVSLVRRHGNVLLLRSLSKGYSLAGLRFGYAIGAPALIEPMLTKTRDSYNVDAIAQRLAEMALRHREDAAQSWAAVRAERTRVRAAFTELGLASPPSESNFILATFPGQDAALRVQSLLEGEEIYVRRFSGPRLDDKLRITIGTPAQNDRLLEVVQRIL